jgi:hypothetical protein
MRRLSYVVLDRPPTTGNWKETGNEEQRGKHKSKQKK